MQKFILFFVLTILFLAFAAFLFNTYIQSKYYFDRLNEEQRPNLITPSPEAGIPSVYKDYSKVSYDTALREKRVLVLYFTSNWCADCLKQEVVNAQTFAQLNKEGVVGLEIHILDSETTTETDAVAKKFDITKESSYVFLDKDGKVDSKYVGFMTNEELKERIINAN